MLVVVSILFVACPRASAQNINFTCANGAVMLSGYSGDQCSGGAVPQTENNTLLAYYTPTGITVDNVAGFDYNENQGEALNANTAGVVGDPSLAIGLGCGFCNQSGAPRPAIPSKPALSLSQALPIRGLNLTASTCY